MEMLVIIIIKYSILNIDTTKFEFDKISFPDSKKEIIISINIK